MFVLLFWCSLAYRLSCLCMRFHQIIFLSWSYFIFKKKWALVRFAGLSAFKDWTHGRRGFWAMFSYTCAVYIMWLRAWCNLKVHIEVMIVRLKSGRWTHVIASTLVSELPRKMILCMYYGGSYFSCILAVKNNYMRIFQA